MAVTVVNSLLLTKCTSTEISIIGIPYQLEVSYLKKKEVKEILKCEKINFQNSLVTEGH